jgi:hypothetical protein
VEKKAPWVGVTATTHRFPQRVARQRKGHECNGGPIVEVASSALRREEGTLNTAPPASRARRRQPPRVVAGPRVIGLRIVVPRGARLLELSHDEAGAIGRVVRRLESLHLIGARLRPRREPARLGQHVAPKDAHLAQRGPQPAGARPYDDAAERAWS